MGRTVLLTVLFSVLVALPTNAQMEPRELSPSNIGRPDEFDDLHITIDARINYDSARVSGTVAHRLILLADSMRAIRFDADSMMRFGRVTVNGATAEYEFASQAIYVALDGSRRRGDTILVAIPWSVTPLSGMHFKGEGTPASPHQVWTQGEDAEHHHWVPLADRPDDLVTNEVHVEVPSDWRVLSNGRFIGMRPNENGTTTWSWLQELPHAPYLMTVVAGSFHVHRDTVGSTPLEYWVAPNDSEYVASTFGRTPRLLRFLEEYLGVAYPWPKYAQVVVDDFMHGGMENTSATTLNAGVVVAPGAVDYTPDGVIAHEIAHQWFGDLVTLRSWKEIWLHESFAEYLELRALQDVYGEDRFLATLEQHRRAAIAFDRGPERSPLVGGMRATSNVYYRGAVLLHMLCRFLGDEAFRQGCRTFLTRHAHGNVDTDDLQRAMEEASGRSLEGFFRQWFHGAGHPILRVETDYRRDDLRVRIVQEQPRDALTGLFDLEVPIEIHCVDGTIIDTVARVGQQETVVSVPLHAAPRYTIIDPGGDLFKELYFERSIDELLAQLRAPRAYDRYEAARALGDREEPVGPEQSGASERIALLEKLFEREASPLVRRQMLRAGRRLAGDLPPMELYRRASLDTSRDVRREVIDQLSRASAIVSARHLLVGMLNDPSDLTAAEVVAALAPIDTSELRPTLERLRGRRGRRDQVADLWLSAVMSGGFQHFTEGVASYTRPPYGSNTRAYAFDVLATLGVVDDIVISSLTDGLSHANVVIRSAAALCARKLMNTEVHSMLARLRERVTGDQLTTVRGLLEDP